MCKHREREREASKLISRLLSGSPSHMQSLGRGRIFRMFASPGGLSLHQSHLTQRRQPFHFSKSQISEIFANLQPDGLAPCPVQWMEANQSQG